jgi:hypothetical protein
MNIQELVAVLGWKIEGEDNLKRFQRGMDQTSKSLTAFSVAVGTIAAAAITKFADAVSSMPGDIIKVSAEFESFHSTLETITGSAQAADKAMEWISKFAQTTPYDVAGVTDAFVKLKAYGIDPIADDALRTLGDAAAAMNKPLNQAVEALADATTFEFERLKEFGLTTQQAGDKVTFRWTENGKQLTKTVKKNAEDVRRFVLDQLGGRFNGAMIRQSKTWNGMMSNLADTWTNFQLRIGRSGFFDAVKSKLADLLDYVGSLDADGSLDRWASNIGEAFKTVVDQATRITKNIIAFAETMRKYAPDFETFKAFLIALGIRLFPVAAFLGFAALAIEDFLTYMAGGKSVLGDFIDALAEFMGADPQKVADVLGAIAKGAMGLLTAAIGVAFFSSTLRGLASALGLLGGTSAAAGMGLLSRLGFLGVAGGAVGGVGALVNPGDGLKNAPRSKWGVDDVIRSLFGTDGSSPTPSPEKKASLDVPLMMSQRISNAQANIANMNTARQATTPGPVNDNRNQSVTVQVGGVTVNGVQSAGAATGAAVGNAVGQSAARAARFEKDDSF